MKLLNKVLHILAVAGSVAAIVFLFFSFADVTVAGKESSIAGSLMLFRSSLADGTKMFVSSKLVFVMLLNLIALIYSGLSFSGKFKSTRFVAAGFALANAIYTLVYVLKTPAAFLDLRAVKGMTAVAYGSGLYLMFAGICVAAVAGIAYLFLDDYIIAKETGSATIIKKVVTFLKDYKSEAKKIVWPDVKSVVKNTIIVLIICGIVGIFIWAVDFGLSKLLGLLWG